MAYIYPAPGSDGVEATLKITNVAAASDPGLTVPAMQDVTVNNANDVFSWTTLDSGSKYQLATTSTNDISVNIVLDQEVFFGAESGTPDPTASAAENGIFNLSKYKCKVSFELFLGKEDDGGAGKTISGEGYITGLSPTVSADSPVWVSPLTISVTGDYTVA